MKKTITLISGLLLSINLTVIAQSVIENVNFDNYVSTTNNDLQNHFHSNFAGMSLTAIPTNGITGGCLVTLDTNNWGNDNSIYCSKFKGVIGSTYVVSIAFKYDSTVVNTSRYERAVSIWLTPASDFNHYLIATIERTKLFGQITYGWINSTSPYLPLLNNYWYKFSLSVTFTGGATNDQVDVVSNAYNLGISGTSIPALIGTLSGTFNDITLISDTAIAVGINGAHWGGSVYLDNFYYQGIKSGDSCLSITTGINEAKPESTDLSYTVANNILHLVSENDFKNGEVSIYNLNGEKVVEYKLTSPTSDYNLSQLAGGMYFFNVRTLKKNYTAKFVIAKGQ